MTDYKKDDAVYLIKLKKYGTVLGLSKPGVYKVAVGTLVVECRGGDLNPIAKSPKQPKPVLIEGKLKSQRPLADSNRRAAEKVDLHGMRVEDAMREVEKAIDRAILAEVHRMEIVHGIGSGKIREALHKYLAALNVIESFKVDDVNPGVTWVYF